MRHRFATLLAVLLLALTSGAAPTTAPATAPAERPAAVPPPRRASFGSYQLVIDRNLFLKDRRNAGRGGLDRGADRFRPPAPVTTTSNLVLTGTVLLGGEQTAFLEDTVAGKTLRVRCGEPLGNGKLAAVGVDYVRFDGPAGTVHVAIGCGLDGRPASVPIVVETVAAAPGAGAGAATQPTTQPDTAGPGPVEVAAAAPPPPTAGAARPPAGGTGASESDIIAKMKAKRAAEGNR
jgi:hypothetical protein